MSHGHHSRSGRQQDHSASAQSGLMPTADCARQASDENGNTCLSRQSWLVCYVASVSFSKAFDSAEIESLVRAALSATPDAVAESMARGNLELADFANLISPAGTDHLESLCRRSQQVTQQRFGKVIRLFAPLYLSNEC